MTRASKPGAACAAVCVLALFFSSSAGAQPSSPVVFVVPRGSGDPHADAALAAIRTEIGDAGVNLLVETFSPEATALRAQMAYAAGLARAHAALGAFWLVSSAAGDDLLYLVDPTATRFLVRHVRYDPAVREAGIEEIAVITRAMALALAEGREIGMTPLHLPDEPEARPKPAEPPPATPRSHHWDLGATYLGATFSSAVTWQSGVGVGGAWSPDGHFRIGVGGGLFLPSRLETSQATLEITRVPLEGLLGEEGRVGPITLGGEVAAVTEYTVRSTRSVAAGLTAAPGATHWDEALAARLRLTWPADGTLRAVVRPGVEIPLTTERYVLDSGATVATLSGVRLCADVGIVWSF